MVRRQMNISGVVMVTVAAWLEWLERGEEGVWKSQGRGSREGVYRGSGILTGNWKVPRWGKCAVED